MNGVRLFCQYDIEDMMRSLKQKMIDEINGLSGDYVLSTSAIDLKGYFYMKYSLSVPELKNDIQADVQNARIEIGDAFSQERIKTLGTEFKFYIPFEGQKELLNYRPNHFTYSPPIAVVEKSQLIFTYQHPYMGLEGSEREAENAKQNFETDLRQVQEYLVWMSDDIKLYHLELQATMDAQITSRQQKSLRDRGMAASLGYPLKRHGTEQTIVPLSRRKPVMPKPLPPKEAFQPEFELDMAEYEFILQFWKIWQRWLNAARKG